MSLKRQLLIVGNGDFAELWEYYVRNYFSQFNVAAFTVDAAYIQKPFLTGIPVVPFESLQKQYPPAEYEILIAIGYKQMNIVRAKKVQECGAMGYNMPNFVHPSAYSDKDVVLGKANLILERTVLAHGVKIGDGNILWNSVNLSHEAQIGDFNYLSPGTILAGKANVGSYCFFGIGSSVRGNRMIKDYTLVGAEAYINEETISYGVYVPARTVVLPNKKSTDLPFQR